MVGTLLSMLKTSCAEGLSADGNQCKPPSSNESNTVAWIAGIIMGVFATMAFGRLVLYFAKNPDVHLLMKLSFDVPWFTKLSAWQKFRSLLASFLRMPPL